MTEIRADDYFAIIPEWVLLAEISSNAVRLYGILNRFANSRGHAWPSRKTIADQMRCSTATVDRAREELVDIGALTVMARTNDAGDPTSNLYIVHTRPSSPVQKGLLTGEERGMVTGDDLIKASMNQSQSLVNTPPVTKPSSFCRSCHGKKIVITGGWYDEDRGGWTGTLPKPCPECQL